VDTAFKACMSHDCTITSQLHNSPGDGARELFKPSKDAACLLVSFFLNWKVLDFIFCGRCHKWGRFKPFLAQVTWTWAPTATGNFLTQVFIGN